MAENPYAKYVVAPAAPPVAENPYAKFAAAAAAPVPAEAPPPAPEPVKKPEWSDLPGNIVPSAVQLAKDVTYPIRHPIEFGEGVYKLATDKDTRAAVGQFYKDRYGGLENLHDTLIKDPVGAVSDLASVLTLGGGLAAKLPGQAGKAAAVASKVGSAIDPIANAGRAVGKIGQGVGWLASEGLGKTAFLGGGDAIRNAVGAGFKNDKTFIPNLQDKVPTTKLVDDLSTGINTIKQKMQADYRQKMPQLSQATIDTTPLHEKFARLIADADSPGPQNLADKTSPDTLTKLKPIKDAIDDATTTTKNQWVDIPEYKSGGKWMDVKTPKPVDIFALDALKQKIGDFWREPGARTPHVQRIITAMEDDIRKLITTEAPEYAAIMEKYSDASEMLNDMRASLSAKKNVQADTTLMKLRRTLNDSPQGKRGAKMIDIIEKEGGVSLRPAIAGQAMQNWFPGGGHLLAKLGGLTAAGGGLTSAVAGLGPAGMLLAPAFSPKALGYGSYALGQGARLASKAAPVLGVTTPALRANAAISRPLQDERVKRAKKRAGVE